MLIHLGLVIAIFHGEDGSVWTAALLTLPAAPALLCQQVGLGILQGQQRFLAFNIYRLVPLATYAAVLVVVALGGLGTLVACAVAWSGAWLLAGIVTIRTALRELAATSGDHTIDQKSFFRFGRRGLLGSVFPVESFQLDQLIVGLLLSPAALGLYVVAVALTNLPRFVAQSMGILAYPRVAAQLEPWVATCLLWRYFGICVAFNALIVGVLEFTVEDIIPSLFGKDYANAVGIAQILLLGSFLQSARRVLADGARGLGHTGLSSLAEVCSWFVLVPALILLAPLGAEGVALAIVAMSGASLGVLVLGIIMMGGQRPARPSATDEVIPPEAATSSLGGTG
jgi:O-antigen/teichoic acid export membrane protein